MDGKIKTAQDNIITAYIAQIDSSMKISEIVSEHDTTTDEIRADDIISGLVYRLMVPMTDSEMSESFIKAQSIMNDELSSGEEDEEDEEDEEKNNNEVYPSIINNYGVRKVIRNNCQCKICKKVRECLTLYDNYQPLDPLATKFKDSINKSCTIHNLVI